MIGLRIDGSRGALIEVNSETDFVARNSMFQEFVGKALSAALEQAGAVHGAGVASERDAKILQSLDVQELLQIQPPGTVLGLGRA